MRLDTFFKGLARKERSALGEPKQTKTVGFFVSADDEKVGQPVMI